MYAQGSKRYGNSAAVAGADFTVSDQRAHLSGYLVRIREDRTRLGPWQQAAIRPIPPVGKGFGSEGMTHLPRRPFHRRPSAAHRTQVWIEFADRRYDCDRQCAVGLRLVVESTVRFDVMQRGAFGSSDRVERSKLRQKQFPDFVRGQKLRPPTETLAVVKSGVGPDCDLVTHCHRHGRPHGVGVARVNSARNVG
jgi:hypothetical protein